MLFNSYGFIVFFPIVVIVYFLLPKRVSYLWLLTASYYFYMGWNAKYALLLLASTIITYVCGVLIQWLNDRHPDKISTKKWVVAGSFILNRRWHISLSSWFKDYLYIPLGGNRKGKIRKYINIMIVFLVSGLWHGANWSYVVWGGLNGIYQVIGAVFTPFRNKIKENLHLKKNCLPLMIVYMFVTFILVDLTWIFFRADTIQHAFDII